MAQLPGVTFDAPRFAAGGSLTFPAAIPTRPVGFAYFGPNLNLLQAQAVPGPLPIFGIAAAFGYSRKLRKRIKNSKPEVISTTAV
jgi:hypothetical protein